MTELESAILSMQFHDVDYKVIIGSEDNHYDHGAEPYIAVFYKEKEIYDHWGIYLPNLISNLHEFLHKHKEKNNESK